MRRSLLPVIGLLLLLAGAASYTFGVQIERRRQVEGQARAYLKGGASLADACQTKSSSKIELALWAEVGKLEFDQASEKPFVPSSASAEAKATTYVLLSKLAQQQGAASRSNELASLAVAACESAKVGNCSPQHLENEARGFIKGVKECTFLQ